MKKFQSWLEIRDRTLEYLQSQVPSWPPYIVQDFVYKGFKNNPDQSGGWLEKFAKWTGHNSPNDIRWQLKTIPVKFESFDQNTQEILRQRMGGGVMQGTPNDQERHAVQAKKLAQAPSQEPIIVAITPSGYSLQEGWHRTVQSLKNWPEGYKQSAWVFQSNNDLSPSSF
jgi:hypothetical protein